MLPTVGYDFIVKLYIYRVIDCTAVKALLLSSMEISIDFKHGNLVVIYRQPVLFAFGMILCLHGKLLVLNRNIIKTSAHIQFVKLVQKNGHGTTVRNDMMHINHYGVFIYTHAQKRCF